VVWSRIYTGALLEAGTAARPMGVQHFQITEGFVTVAGVSGGLSDSLRVAFKVTPA